MELSVEENAAPRRVGWLDALRFEHRLFDILLALVLPAVIT